MSDEAPSGLADPAVATYCPILTLTAAIKKAKGQL